MKLRLLNGSHSLMAYLGQLAGLETIADCMAEPALARLVRAMMDKEVTPTLATPARRRCRGVQGRADRAVRQPGAAPPDGADRPGRVAEAAAAAARADPTAAGGRVPGSTGWRWVSPPGSPMPVGSAIRRGRARWTIRWPSASRRRGQRPAAILGLCCRNSWRSSRFSGPTCRGTGRSSKRSAAGSTAWPATAPGRRSGRRRIHSPKVSPSASSYGSRSMASTPIT